MKKIIKNIRQYFHHCDWYLCSSKYIGRDGRRLFYSCPVCGCIRVDAFMGQKDWDKYPENNGKELNEMYKHHNNIFGTVFKVMPSYLLGIGDYDAPVDMTTGKNW